MRIGFDARLYGLKHAGIGRYVMNLLEYLAEIDTENQYIIITNSDTKLGKIPRLSEVIRCDIRHYSLAEQTNFLAVLHKIDIDFFHFPHFNVPYLYRKPYVVTIHDLLWHQKKGLTVTTLPAPIYALKYFGYRAVISNAITTSKHVVTPAEHVKASIKKVFDKPLDQISVTYESADKKYFEPVSKKVKSSVLKKYKLEQPFIIYTGSLYPHKNVPIILEALQKIESLHFAIASSRNIFTDQFLAQVKKMGLANRVKMLGFVLDEDLKALYTHATALIQPSESEGFGLTGLEAMAVGLPVVAAKQPVLKEVYGNAALYFDYTNAQELAINLTKLIKDTTLQKNLIKKGHTQAKKYSWVKMARQTLEVYNSLELRV